MLETKETSSLFPSNFELMLSPSPLIYQQRKMKGSAKENQIKRAKAFGSKGKPRGIQETPKPQLQLQL